MGTKMSDLTAYASTLASGDLVEIVDVSDTTDGAGGTSKQMTVANVIANSPNGGLPELGSANTFTANQSIDTGAEGRLTLGDTAASEYGTVRVLCGSAKYSWLVGGQNNVDNGFEITPSTAAGGTTFSTPALQIMAGSNNDVRPGQDNVQDLGGPSNRWVDIYATNATIQTSDERDKRDIADCPLGLDFLRALRPVEYKWKDVSAASKEHVTEQPVTENVERQRTVVEQDEAGRWVRRTITETVRVPVMDVVPLYDESGNEIGTHEVPRMKTVTETVTTRPAQTYTRPHYGLIAQEVKAAMDAQNIADFAGYIYDPEADKHGLRYGEFTALLIQAIQDGAAIIESLQAQVAGLESRLAALEAV